MTRKISTEERMIELRRRFHQHPEPSWREFNTTRIIKEELNKIGVNHVFLGSEAMDVDARTNIPPDEELEKWEDRAREEGTPDDLLERMKGGLTGAVAVLEEGTGPTVGLRVDIDALMIEESSHSDHRPNSEEFQSKFEGCMHACGHDAKAAMGLGVLENLKGSNFGGKLKVFFQPAAELEAGGKPFSKTAHIKDVDIMYRPGLGMGYSTGTVVSGAKDMFGIDRFIANFSGEATHSTLAPHEGRNTIQAATTAVQNLYSIPRHGAGKTRVNVSSISGGDSERLSTTIIPEKSSFKAEIRGETKETIEYMREYSNNIIQKSADLHNCDVSIDVICQIPYCTSDSQASKLIEESAKKNPLINSVLIDKPFNAGCDSAYILNSVKENGGYAAAPVIGSDISASHHSSRFDIDETSLKIGANVLSNAAERAANSNI